VPHLFLPCSFTLSAGKESGSLGPSAGSCIMTSQRNSRHLIFWQINGGEEVKFPPYKTMLTPTPCPISSRNAWLVYLHKKKITLQFIMHHTLLASARDYFGVDDRASHRHTCHVFYGAIEHAGDQFLIISHYSALPMDKSVIRLHVLLRFVMCCE
jgi:hypothetical protein